MMGELLAVKGMGACTLHREHDQGEEDSCTLEEARCPEDWLLEVRSLETGLCSQSHLVSSSCDLKP